MIKKFLPPLAASALLPAFLVGCSDAPGEPRRPSVLLISVDTLRADHLSLYGYERSTSPRIDAFFSAGQVYERAYSTEAATTPSVVSMLSGLYPARHGVRLLFQHVSPDLQLLPDLLRASGYDTAGVVSNAVLTEEASDLARHFDHYDDFVDEKEIGRDNYERRAERTTAAALEWLTTGRDPARPHFLWVHYIDPHGPYTPPEDGPARFEHEGSLPVEEDRIQGYQLIDGVTDALDYVDRYDEEIAYMDREVGRLLDAYAELGLLDDTVVAFTADHGETMVEHERWFTHGYDVWESIVRVPLMLRVPGGAPARIEHPVSLVDLLPTLATAVGLEAPQGLDGLPLDRRPPGSAVSVEAGAGKRLKRARIEGDRKWFVTVDDDGNVRRRGWLRLDAEGESNERLRRKAAGPEVEAGFRELVQWAEADPDPGGVPRELERGTHLDGPKVAPGRTPEQLEALRALGYVDLE